MLEKIIDIVRKSSELMREEIDVVQKGNIPVPKPNSTPKPQPQPQKSESKREETPTLAEVKEAFDSAEELEASDSTPKASSKGRRFEDMHSDTVNMVMDIFDGKVID